MNHEETLMTFSLFPEMWLVYFWQIFICIRVIICRLNHFLPKLYPVAFICWTLPIITRKKRLRIYITMGVEQKPYWQFGMA